MMEIAGLTPFTTIDYPGKLSAVLFCQGCPWRCGYCHNPHLQPFGKGAIGWQSALQFLEKRRGLLDAVVFSGGEPSMQPTISDAMQEVRKKGFLVGLHTAGILPSALEKALAHCDWVGMDIKAPFEDYERITKRPGSGEKARQSAQLVIESGIDYEFRTTIHPKLLSPIDIDRLTEHLSQMGAKRLVLQNFRADGCRDKSLNASAFDILWDDGFLDRIQRRFESFFVR